MALRRPRLFTRKYPFVSTANQVNRARSVPVESKHAFGYLQTLLTPDYIHPHVPHIVGEIKGKNVNTNWGYGVMVMNVEE